MRILQVNTADFGGGAEVVARSLFEGYRARGHWSRLVVGIKRLDDPDIISLPRPGQASRVAALARGLAGERIASLAANPRGAAAHLIGSEDVHSPASWSLLDRFGSPGPDILHCHNLHGSDYFDIRALPALSRRVPVVLTLHDAWLLSGHCAHSVSCDRWRTGCGHCPDLSLYPAIRRDRTAANYGQKRDVFAQMHVRVSAPSAWLLDRALRSHLGPSIVEGRVIPNGVNTRVFKPAPRAEVRKRLALPVFGRVLLALAPGTNVSHWKDYSTLRAALGRLANEELSEPLVCVLLGQDAPTERIGRIELRYVPWQIEQERVANLYQAADVYVHAARVDTFPLTVIEALACGTPVVASCVGGIAEQLRHLACDSLADVQGVTRVSRESATGVLVPAGDAPALSQALRVLLGDAQLLANLSANARREAVAWFNQDEIVDTWLGWYAEIIADAYWGI